MTLVPFRGDMRFLAGFPQVSPADAGEPTTFLRPFTAPYVPGFNITERRDLRLNGDTVLTRSSGGYARA